MADKALIWLGSSLKDLQPFPRSLGAWRGSSFGEFSKGSTRTTGRP